MATDLELFGFREVGGTRGDDTFTSTSPATVHLGGPGDDLFIASDVIDPETGAHFFLGGTGSDAFQLDPETFTVIGDGGGRDVVLAPGLSFSGATVFEVDRQHLGVVDPDTGAGLVILDWFGNRIESIEFADGVRRIGIDINPVQLRFQPGIITDLSFAELSLAGVLPAGVFLDDDLIEALTARGEAFEGEAGEGLSIVGSEAGEVLTGGDGPDFLDGAGGNDRIDGLAGDDRLLGGDGDDLIIAGDGADDVDGGRGDDQISGDAGSDVLRGGDGNDRLQGGGQADRLEGGRGDDDLDGSGGADTLVGGDGNDRLDGGRGDDTLLGGRGDDRLDGGRGDDTLRGGADDDRLDGGGGADELRGGGGNDVLDGGNGRDELRGGRGNDDLTGGGGNDVLRGGAGQDTLEGDQGRDLLRGGRGNDDLSGSGGRDVLIGGGGNDRLDGGADRDVLTGGRGQDRFTVSVLDGERDRITDHQAGEVIDLSGVVDVMPTDSLEGFVRVETLLGRGFTRLDVDPSGSGDDFVPAVRLDDVLIEEFTAAQLGFAADLEGPPLPPNRDPIARDDSDRTNEDTAININVLANDRDPNGNPFRVVEVEQADTDAELTITANGRIRFDPRGAFDELAVGDSATETFGYTIEDSRGGRDTAEVTVEVRGRNDAPEVTADPTAPDAAVGGAYSFELPDDTFVDPDQGDELTLTATAADGSALPGWLDFDPATGEFSGTPDAGDLGQVNVAVQATDEEGLEAETTFAFEVLAGGVTLLGDEEVNVLSGGSGNDVIRGEGGADQLSGGAGNDRIEGGTGGDTITGGPGDDILRGDPEGGPFSTDFFVFEAIGDALDRIEDFETGDGGDVLVLDDLVEGDAGRVSVVDRGSETAVRVDAVDLVVLEGVSGTSLATLVDDGNLTVGAAV